MIILPYILVTIGWILFIIVDYYAHTQVFEPMLIVATISICIFSVIFILRMFLKKDSIGKGLYNMSVVLFLVVLLFCHAPAICLAEDADWLINYHSRMKVVEKIKTRSYHSDEPISKSSSDEYSYENRQLPFRFPVLSPPHNVVFITRNTNQNTYSVFFDVYGSFCTEQTYFVYTNDEKQKTHFEDKIIRNSKNNWRLRDKWYRIKEY